MGLEGSLQFSQKPATGTYPEPAESRQHPYTLLTIHFNIIFSIRLVLPSGLFPSGFSTKIHAFLISDVRSTCPLDVSNKYLVKSTNYESFHFIISPFSCYFLSLRRKYSQHFFLEHPQFALFPWVGDQVSDEHKPQAKLHFYGNRLILILDSRREDKRP
jgi:hypothetical protein